MATRNSTDPITGLQRRPKQRVQRKATDSHATSLGQDGSQQVCSKHQWTTVEDAKLVECLLEMVNFTTIREKMGKYCTEVRKVGLELMEAITESLGLGSTYLSDKLAEGTQVMAVNRYPPCPKPDIALGLPPHSDYSCLTIVLQSSPGLEIMDTESEAWRIVPDLQGALQVHVGDHFEVLSNGLYRSVVHRVILNCERTRISIASLHSLGMDEKMETAKELVDEQHPKIYKEGSFKEFLNFLSTNDIGEGKSFINTLKIKK